MSEIEPLLKSGAPEHVLRLLRAGRVDAANDSERNQARLLAAAAALQIPVGPSKAMGTARAALYFGGGTLVVAGLLGLLTVVEHRSELVQAKPARLQRTAPPSLAPALPPTPVDVPGIAVESLPLLPPSVEHARRDVPVTAPVMDELSRLDEARRLLTHGDAAGALDQIQRYRVDHPSGRYADEASALEVHIQFALGPSERARELASKFLREHPSSPHSERLRRLLETKR